MTIHRREFLIGAGCAIAAAGAAYLKPRNRLSLIGNGKLETLVPKAFGDWTYRSSDAIVVPEGDDSLAARLYSQTVARLYENRQGEAVMLLIAYGDTQSDQLQLHRPEVCYPAFGFEVSRSTERVLELAPGLSIPGRTLRAHSPARSEAIAYWARIGEYLPASASEQRTAGLRSKIDGVIPDGVLVRLSNSLTDLEAAFALNRSFAAALIAAVPVSGRAALIGTERAALSARAFAP